MNVFELKSGRPRLIHPDFNDLAGEAEFPLWFIREVKSLLSSKELYAIAAGVGLISRYTTYVAENYAALTLHNDETKLPIWRAIQWSEGVAKLYQQNILDAAIHEVDDIADGFGTLQKVVKRNPTAGASLARSLRLRRDDLESVSLVCTLWQQTQVLKEIDRIDALAASCRAMLCDDHRQGIDRRLNVMFEMNPRRWWGVKGTL